MMTRSPLRTRSSTTAPADTQKPGRQKDLLPKRLLAPIAPLGRPYESEEEKRQVYTDLIRLKASGKSNRECGEILGVTSRTIDNYRADPFYVELEQDLESHARARGYHIIGELITDALSTMYEIMETGHSEFVRYKAAETLLNYAGYSIPRETAVAHNRDEAVKFLEEVKSRQQGGLLQVNVQVNQLPTAAAGEPGGTTAGLVETQLVEEPPPLVTDVSPYYSPVLPGGRLPEQFHGVTKKKEPQDDHPTTSAEVLADADNY